MPTQDTFDADFSIAKIIINIGLANGIILKLWAAQPYQKFSWEAPLPCMEIAGKQENKLSD